MARSASFAVALIALALIIAVPLADGKSAAAAVDIQVSGQIVTGFDHEGNLIPLSGVGIYVNDMWVDETDDNGVFSFMIAPAPPPGTYQLDPRLAGYAVLNADALLIDTTAGDVIVPTVVMVEAFGTIKGSVTNNGNPVSGVSVYVHDRVTGDLVARTVSADGKYSVVCRTGDYTVSVSSPYYEAPSIDVDLGMEIKEGVNFELTVKPGTTYLFGLDLTHSMMVIGGILGMIMLIFAILYRINIGKHPETSKIQSNEKKKDQD